MKTENKKTSILIVDDREENLLVLEELLDDFDLNIIKARSGSEALERLLEYSFALILMDVQMPGMDGFETAELMRGTARTRDVPIIFVTAINKEEKHIFKGYESGAVDYLFKPLQPYILKSKVSIFVRLFQQNRELEQKITQLEKANTKIKQLSITDALTGCYNRSYLNERLPKEIKRSQRYEIPISLILNDIDFFKKVNDTYGHQCGDQVLHAFVKILQQQIRQDIDWICRYGGEEFIVILPVTDLTGAAINAERLRRAVDETPIYYNDQELKITASFGVATAESHIEDPHKVLEQLLQTADKRLYTAKKEGRNRVVAG